MHELGVISNLVETTERIALRNGVHKIGYIKLDVGEVSGVVSSYMKTLWGMGTKGTLLEGAELIINDVPAIVECLDCGEQFSLMKSADENHDKPQCPKCSSKSFSLVDEHCKEVMIMELGAED
jgi:hydrogenase nickel incorporation protein HypA/HybF